MRQLTNSIFYKLVPPYLVTNCGHSDFQEQDRRIISSFTTSQHFSVIIFCIWLSRQKDLPIQYTNHKKTQDKVVLCEIQNFLCQKFLFEKEGETSWWLSCKLVGLYWLNRPTYRVILKERKNSLTQHNSINFRAIWLKFLQLAETFMQLCYFISHPYKNRKFAKKFVYLSL